MNRDWSAMPMDLLDCVVRRIESLPDYVRFSLVCSSWRYCAANSQAAKMVSKSWYGPPMLLIPSDKVDTWKVYNVMNNRILDDLQLKVPDRRFCGSSNGWLIVVEENFAVTLINPFSRVKEKRNSVIHLPPLVDFSRENYDLMRWGDTPHVYYVWRATLSGDPLLNSDNCIVVVTYGNRRQLAFIRLGKDEKWNFVRKRFLQNEDIAYFQGKFFTPNAVAVLQSINTTTGPKFICEDEGCYPGSSSRKGFAEIRKYLVDCNGEELLMVTRIIRYIDRKTNCNTWNFEVWRMDFDRSEWIRKDTLGNVAIFLGNNSSVSMIAPNPEFPGCHPNCIYFSHDSDLDKYYHEDTGPNDLGVYDLQDGSVSSYTALVDPIMKMTKQSPTPIWVEPTLQLSSTSESC